MPYLQCWLLLKVSRYPLSSFSNLWRGTIARTISSPLLFFCSHLQSSMRKQKSRNILLASIAVIQQFLERCTAKQQHASSHLRCPAMLNCRANIDAHIFNIQMSLVRLVSMWPVLLGSMYSTSLYFLRFFFPWRGELNGSQF
jgi:hypothetical protein